MNSEKIYKDIYRGILLRYFLSCKEECVVARTFINVGNGRLLYEDLNGNRLLFEKERLYSKLENDGITIKEYNNEYDSTTVSYFIISKKSIKEKMNILKSERVKKKGSK